MKKMKKTILIAAITASVLTVPEQAFDKMGFVNELKKFRELLLKQNKLKQQGLPSIINP